MDTVLSTLVVEAVKKLWTPSGFWAGLQQRKRHCCNALILHLNPACEEAETPVRLNLLALSPCLYRISLAPKIRSGRLRLMLAACVLMHDSDGDAIGRQRYKHTAAPVRGFVVLNFRQRCDRATYPPGDDVARQILGMKCSAPLRSESCCRHWGKMVLHALNLSLNCSMTSLYLLFALLLSLKDSSIIKNDLVLTSTGLWNHALVYTQALTELLLDSSHLILFVYYLN